jgi:hypothetical protein
MPSERTMVTELGTGLGMLGLADLDTAVRSRTPVMRSLSPEIWERLEELRSGGAYDAEFHGAWANGQAFLAASEGLRGRLPTIVEWKGTGRAPGDEVAPIDLRVDHVYLISCKYLSNILFNVSPAHVFDSLLVGGPWRHGRPAQDDDAHGGGGSAPDWYAAVASGPYQALYEAVRTAAAGWAETENGGRVGSPPGADGAPRPATPARRGRTDGSVALPGFGTGDGADEARSDRVPERQAGGAPEVLRQLPARAVDLTVVQRDALGRWLRTGWPDGAKELYAALSDDVARASARRWAATLDGAGSQGEAMIWRLLRIGSAPYFVLGSSAERSLRLRIATSWDWRQRYQLRSIAVEPQPGGQPRVGWRALVRDRASHEVHEVAGHIEVRWSHGRFGGLPEAKGYLDTPHHLVPGYFTLR